MTLLRLGSIYDPRILQDLQMFETAGSWKTLCPGLCYLVSSLYSVCAPASKISLPTGTHAMQIIVIAIAGGGRAGGLPPEGRWEGEATAV